MLHPTFLPAGAVLAGVWIGAAAPVDAVSSFAIALVAAWMLALAAYERESARGVALASALAFGLAGAALVAHAQARATAAPLRHLLLAEPGVVGGRSPVLLEGRLWEDAAPTDTGVSLVLDVTRVTVGRRSVTTRGGVRLAVGGNVEPTAVRAWRAGRRLRVWALVREPNAYRNPGGAGADEPLRLARRGIVLVGSVKSGRLVELAAPGGPWAEQAAAVRALVRRAVERHVGRHDVRTAGIVTAILIGDRAGLGPEVERRLQEAGTYHVIAISGGNIAILAGLLLGLFRLAHAPPRLASTLTMVALGAYAALVGSEPSVVRATLVAILYLAARVLDHRPPALNSLAGAAALIGCIAPLSVFDAGFALSFGATAAILVGVPRVHTAVAIACAARGRVWPHWLLPPLGLLAATLCAELAVAPLGAAWFSRVTFAGVLLNFAAVPLMTIVQVAGLATVGLAGLGAWLADRAGDVAHLAARGLIDSARAAELAPWLVRRVPPPPIGVLAAYYAGWGLWLAERRRRSWRLAGLALVGLMGLAIVAAPARPGFGASRGWLRVVFLDVGQGDATAVLLPDGRALLVDAGGAAGGRFDIGGRIVAPALWALGVRRLEALVITHGDPDHIGGAAAVVRDFRPRAVWEGVPVPALEATRALAAEPVVLGGEWWQVQAGDRLRLGAVEIVTLHPPPAEWERQAVRNDDSVVLDVRYGRVSILLTGDIGRDVEPRVAARLEPAAVRVLKVPHHGSAASSTAAFLAAARPAVAVVSAGRYNLFGHPAPAVVARYRAAGIALLRTDRDGAVMAATDGTRVEMFTWSGAAAAPWRRVRTMYP